MDFNEGDTVEFVKGKSRIGGVVSHRSGGGLGIEDTGWTTQGLEHQGWTLKTIERAKPALPTERGFYLSCNGSDVLYQGEDGTWSDDAKYGVEPVEVSRKHAPLTRLEPVPETAKKVLDSLRKRIGSIDNAYDFHAVGAEFGAES